MASLLSTLASNATLPGTPVPPTNAAIVKQDYASSGKAQVNPGQLLDMNSTAPGVYRPFSTPTTTPVVTSDKASTDLLDKKGHLDTLTKSIADQAAKNTADKTAADTAAATQKQQDVVNQQKQAEIDAKAKVGTDISNLAADQFAGQHPGDTTYGTGTTTDTAGTSTTGFDANKQLLALNAEADKQKADVQNTLDQYKNGSIPLSTNQQSQIDAMKKQFDQMVNDQKTANANYEGGVTNLGVSSGRSRYAPELEMGNIKGAIDEGLAKVNKIQVAEMDAIAKMTQGFEDSNYDAINKSYAELDKLRKEKQDNINQIAKNVTDAADKAAKAKIDAQKEKDSQTKYSFDNLTKIAQSGAALDDEDLKKYDEYLGATGIAKAFYESEKKKAQETQDLKFVNTVKNIPTGTTVTRGDLTYTGIQAGKNKQIAEYDKKTGITTVVTYDAAGNIINSQQKKVGTNSTVKSPSSNSSNSPSGAKTAKQIAAAAQKIQDAINSNNLLGADKKLSPQDYLAAKTEWVNAGYNPTIFDTKFKGYRNPDNQNYGVGKTPVKK